jgi:HK97 family phage prohead protease
MLRGREQARGIDLPVRRVPGLRAGDSGSDGRTLFGHFAVFDAWTELEDWDGVFRERVMPGAFKKTLSERGAPKMMFNHGRGSGLPIGVWADVAEVRTGLYGEVELAATEFNDGTLIPLLRSGAIDGGSFMFDVVREQWQTFDDGRPDERTILEARLWEMGPVTWPAYEQTDVGLRSRIDGNFRGLPAEDRAARFEGWRREISRTVDGAAPGTPRPAASRSTQPDPIEGTTGGSDNTRLRARAALHRLTQGVHS